VYGRAERIVPGENGSGHVVVDTGSDVIRVEADYFLVCAGGLATPVLLARSLGEEAAFCTGYHDHAMTYVAKVRVRPNSLLKNVSCTVVDATEVRAGFAFEADGVKTVVYLRPATGLDLRSIQGAARYVLSDLRNEPFSPGKIFQLLTNLEAAREAVLFKTKAGFRGDYYSLLIMGEQLPIATRGLSLAPGKKPTLNWHVTDRELRAYHASVARFVDTFASDILEINAIPPEQWEFRTAAHHSGASSRFLSDSGDVGLDFFSVKGLPQAFVCDGSLLRATGIANSGLTLVALSTRLAELISVLAPYGVADARFATSAATA